MVISVQMRYSEEHMRTNRHPPHYVFSTSVVKKSLLGIPFAPGLMLILLGLVVLVAPRLVLGALAFLLLGIGALLCYVAYKFVAFKRRVETLAKNFEGSFQTSSFHSSKPDIDLTDLESKKIIYH